jgi:hypothetical protein
MVHPFGCATFSPESVGLCSFCSVRVTIPGKTVGERTLPQGVRVMLAGSKIYRKRKLGWGV